MDNAPVGVVPVAARPGRSWLGLLAGVALGGAGVLTALGWVGSQLPPAVGLPIVPGLLFRSPVLFPAVLAAIGLTVASPGFCSRGQWATTASLVGLVAVLLAEATVAKSSANLLVMYQQSLYDHVRAGGPAAR